MIIRTGVPSLDGLDLCCHMTSCASHYPWVPVRALHLDTPHEVQHVHWSQDAPVQGNHVFIKLPLRMTVCQAAIQEQESGTHMDPDSLVHVPTCTQGARAHL